MKKTRAIFAAAVLAVTGIAAAPQQQAPQADEKSKTIHLLQRATFGVRPEDVDRVTKLGRDKWLDLQLHPDRINDVVAANRLKAFPVVAIPMTDQILTYQRAQMERRQTNQQTNMENMSQADRQAMLDSMRRAEQRKLTPEQRRQRQMQSPQYLMGELVAAKLTRSVYSERQLEEMMTDFWYNHFNVFFGKGIDRYMVTDYEEKAIRPNVFGKFRDMLEASARHPAMLFYLDNANSVVPDSMNTNARRQREQLQRFRELTPQQQEEMLRRRGITREQMEQQLARQATPNRQRGLNENYARELMELHTLGVDGGYTQKDVIEVARAFTGWTFERPAFRQSNPGEVEFIFRPMVHDRGEKLVLGNKLAAGRGIEDGKEVLDILARHPATARFIATKLVARFVADEPPAEYVNEIVAVFQKTDGDLREVTRALFSSPRFYEAKVQRAKVKTPFELVASALRVTHADVGVSRATVMTLRSLGHLPYNEPAPTGFPVASEDWVNSGAMVNRMNFGLSLAANRLDGIKLERRANDDVPVMLARLLPGVNTSKLQTTIMNELAKPAAELPDIGAQQSVDVRMRERPRQNARNTPATAPVREKSARALGLALGSPEFQRK